MLKVSVFIYTQFVSNGTFLPGSRAHAFSGFCFLLSKKASAAQATNSNGGDKVFTEPPSTQSQETKCSMKTVSGIETAVETLAFSF